MSEHLKTYPTALPPPRKAPWLSVHRLAPATVFIGTLIVITLAILSALSLLAATPAGFALPTTLLLIGGLVAGGLAIQTRVALSRRALVGVDKVVSTPTVEIRRNAASQLSVPVPDAAGGRQLEIPSPTAVAPHKAAAPCCPPAHPGCVSA